MSLFHDANPFSLSSGPSLSAPHSFLFQITIFFNGNEVLGSTVDLPALALLFKSIQVDLPDPFFC